MNDFFDVFSLDMITKSPVSYPSVGTAIKKLEDEDTLPTEETLKRLTGAKLTNTSKKKPETCQCPIHHLMAFGHVEGCPEKPTKKWGW